MRIFLKSGLQQKWPVFADLAALVCGGGLVVETPGKPGSILVQSTIQLDGDVTICVARTTLGQATVLVSHLAEVEMRIQRTAMLVKRATWAVHGVIGGIIAVTWFFVLFDSATLENQLATVGSWVGLSLVSAAIVEWLRRTSLVQELFLSSMVNRLSRLAIG